MMSATFKDTSLNCITITLETYLRTEEDNSRWAGQYFPVFVNAQGFVSAFTERIIRPSPKPQKPSETSTHLNHSKSTLISESHQRLGLPNTSLPFSFTAKILYVFHSSQAYHIPRPPDAQRENSS